MSSLLRRTFGALRSRPSRLGTALVLAGLAVVGGVVLGFHPRRPLYMQTEEVRVRADDGVVLRGTLSRPRWGAGPVPVVVLVHGSGRLTRHHLIGDVRALVWRGMAVLAYDKRGVGESGGAYPSTWGAGAEAVLVQLAADAAAVFNHVVQHPGVDPDRAGFFGASQAGWIIPLAAARTSRPPRFHVILSGPAVPTGVEDYYSQLTGDGLRPPRVADPAEVARRVRAFRGAPGFDPVPHLRAMRTPTLWLLGDRDLSVPTFASADVLQALRSAGHVHHVVVRYPTAGHDLRDTATGRAFPVWDDMWRWLSDQRIVD